MYYWHRFYAHQPDLNYDSPEVREEMKSVMRFWLKKGLDGFRCDAVPYLFKRDGTNCENLPETHQFFKDVRRMIDEEFPGKILLAEANQWVEDVIPYFGKGDEFHIAFNFPLMPRIFIALARENNQPIIDIVNQTTGIPPTCSWGTFLRNHDELTLEMVTNEDRDFMYHEYAKSLKMRLNLGIRRRLATLLENNRTKMELIFALLFTLPGSPVIYYGDEIGMGDNIYLGDRNGVRTPMQWSADRNAGFSRCDPEQLYSQIILNPIYHYEAVNVDAQERFESSLLQMVRKMIRTRKKYIAFGRGSIEFMQTINPKVLAFTRQYGEELLLTLFNLSHNAQPVELELKKYNGMRPVEIIGQTPFPKIGELPYFLTLTPHGYLWFKLERQKE
jgi:maltose alpha-D-glucosyltransferase/alpha-amylase